MAGEPHPVIEDHREAREASFQQVENNQARPESDNAGEAEADAGGDAGGDGDAE